MKRVASTTRISKIDERPDDLFCLSPPKSEFSDEDGCVRQEFNRLSPKEQESVVKDIYGISCPVTETPAMVRSSLEKMDLLIRDHLEKKESLRFLQDQSPSLFEDEAFRLKFLCVDSFNVKLATKRMIKHFEKKLELFGSENLSKTIQLKDLDENDMDFMNSGGIQVVPERDRGGRHVVFSRHHTWKYKEIKNILRCMWYILMNMAESSDSKICEIVGISYNLGLFSPDMFDREALKSSFDLYKTIPCKLVGYHYCFDDVRFRMVWGVITIFLGKKVRMRARDHEGSHLECRYGLMSYGIPVNSLPITVDGMTDDTRFLKWLEERQCKEMNHNKDYNTC